MDRLDVVNSVWFVGWLVALTVLFMVGLRLPLQPRLRRLPALAYVAGIVVATLGVVTLANVALVLHDAHFDLTREGVFTPSPQAEGVAGHGHGEGASAIVQMRAHGAGRLRRALEAFGYDVRKIIPATSGAIPADCAAVVDVNPRTTYLPGESDQLVGYLARGGAALLMYDLGFILEPRLRAGLRSIGVTVEQDVVIDPLDHYSTDSEVVAVPVYEPHPITGSIALTFFPGVRSLTLLPPPPGVTSTPLFRSSPESYTHELQPVAQRQPGRASPASPAAAVASRPGRRTLGAAFEGTWPGAPPGSRPFRLVVVGDGDFASNSFLPYMANSDLALAMVRWLVREERTPAVALRMPVP